MQLECLNELVPGDAESTDVLGEGGDLWLWHGGSIIRAMDRIIQEIDAELARLRMARALLGGETNSHKLAKPGRRKMSADGRARIAAAQKARWAKGRVGE